MSRELTQLRAEKAALQESNKQLLQDLATRGKDPEVKRQRQMLSFCFQKGRLLHIW